MTDPSDTVARPPRYWVVLNPGQPGETAVEVRGPRVTIGRGEDCDVVIDDPTVSRHHAAISARPGAPLVLEDLGSANGTLVNGKPIRGSVGFATGPIHPRAELRGGEWIQFGDAQAAVSLLPPGPAD
jgi:pSer/pThr/pTyr-binding forkhead associated (FHA) protein